MYGHHDKVFMWWPKNCCNEQFFVTMRKFLSWWPIFCHECKILVTMTKFCYNDQFFCRNDQFIIATIIFSSWWWNNCHNVKIFVTVTNFSSPCQNISHDEKIFFTITKFSSRWQNIGHGDLVSLSHPIPRYPIIQFWLDSSEIIDFQLSRHQNSFQPLPFEPHSWWFPPPVWLLHPSLSGFQRWSCLRKTW